MLNYLLLFTHGEGKKDKKKNKIQKVVQNSVALKCTTASFKLESAVERVFVQFHVIELTENFGTCGAQPEHDKHTNAINKRQTAHELCV